MTPWEKKKKKRRALIDKREDLVKEISKEVGIGLATLKNFVTRNKLEINRKVIRKAAVGLVEKREKNIRSGREESRKALNKLKFSASRREMRFDAGAPQYQCRVCNLWKHVNEFRPKNSKYGFPIRNRMCRECN
jgi:hypothetical protein